MKKGLLIILIFLSGIKLVNADTSHEKASFVRCVDGDTAVFKIEEEEIKFRFLAIDTPETVHPTIEVEEYGKNASEYTCSLLTNAKEIIVEYENANKKDKYGRSLAWIWVDGKLLQKELISVGYGKVAYIYGKYRYTESLCLIQKEAKELNIGLWNDQNDEEYCSTIDLTNVKDNIKFENINKLEQIPEDLEDLVNVFEGINNVTDKISKYTENNDEKISNILYYAIIGAAVISIIIKSRK